VELGLVLVVGGGEDAGEHVVVVEIRAGAVVRAVARRL
jgi:hypothetical protein